MAEEKDGDWDKCGKESSSPNWYDFVTERVCELRVHNFTVLEVDREGSGWSWSGSVDLEQT